MRKTLYQAELWVDWENFIWINSPTQERFFFGFTTAYAPLGPERLTVGLQAFAHHTGGQIDTANLPVQTLSNVAMSLSWVSMPWAQGRGRAGFDLWGLFSTNAKTLDLPTFTKQGWGGVASAFACFVGCRLSLEYYYGQGFMPLRGHPFYAARSQWSPQGQWERNRSMLTASLGYSKQWYHSISLEALADAHYDLTHRQLDYSFELSIRVALNYAVWTPHSPQVMEP